MNAERYIVELKRELQSNHVKMSEALDALRQQPEQRQAIMLWMEVHVHAVNVSACVSDYCARYSQTLEEEDET